MLDHVLRFFERQIDLPEQRRGDIHGPAQPAKSCALPPTRLPYPPSLVRYFAHAVYSDGDISSAPTFNVYHTALRCKSRLIIGIAHAFRRSLLPALLSVAPCESAKSSIPSRAKAGCSACRRYSFALRAAICAASGATRPTRRGSPKERRGRLAKILREVDKLCRPPRGDHRRRAAAGARRSAELTRQLKQRARTSPSKPRRRFTSRRLPISFR